MRRTGYREALMAEPIQVHGTVAGDRAQVVLAGEMDLRTAEDVRVALDKLIEAGARHLDLDCSGLTFVDSGGLSVLLDLHRRLLRADGSLCLRNCSRFVRQTLDITGLARYIAE